MGQDWGTEEPYVERWVTVRVLVSALACVAFAALAFGSLYATIWVLRMAVGWLL